MLVLLLVPAAQATVVTEFSMTFTADAGEADISYYTILSGKDASDFRGQVDAQGDGDGIATEDEADDVRGDIGDSIAGNMGGDISIDRQDGTETATSAILLSVGDDRPVSSTADVAIDWMGTGSFAPAAGPVHTLHIDAAAFTGESWTITIEVPPGTTIQSHEGLSGATVSADQRTLMGTPGAADVSVTMGPPASATSSSAQGSQSQGTNGATTPARASPALPPAVTLAALGFVAVALRRRTA